jgi:type VI secretion system protein ImpA
MASAEVLDFASLLAPISGENPAGGDIRADVSAGSVYYAIRDARAAARAAERLAEANGEPSGADWKPVLKLVPQVLTQKAKDLEMTAYFIEALVRQHGFAGLRDGFRLARELAQQFWDGLYPLPDEDGLETRVSGLTGLNGGESPGTLIGPIESLLLTKGTSCGPYSYGHYRQASELASLEPEKRDARIAAGAVSMDQFLRAVAETPDSFYVELVADLQSCLDEYGKLTELLDDKCGSSAPPSSNIKTVLYDIRDAVQQFAKSKLPAEGGEAEPGAAPGGDGSGAAAAAAGFGVGPMRTRDDAFNTLRQVADFFRRTEPHSPIPYALERIVRWGNLSLPQLLSELIPDMTARGEYCKVVGIPPEEQSSGY